VGLHGAGKSLTAASIAYHLTEGLEWCGRAAHEHLVVYACPADGGLTRRRLLALAEHHEGDLPRNLRLAREDIRTAPDELADAIDLLKPEHGDCGLIVLDYGHVFDPDWERLGIAAQTLRDRSGAAVMLLQEGTAIPPGLAPGWDCLWRAERSLDELVVLNVEHMRDSGTIGRLCFAVHPVGDSAVLNITGARPVMRPARMTEKHLIVHALQLHAYSMNDWQLGEHEFADIVLQAGVLDATDTQPKHVTQRVKRFRMQLTKLGIVRFKNGIITLNPTWRKARGFQDPAASSEEMYYALKTSKARPTV
jgi:AAA domain